MKNEVLYLLLNNYADHEPVFLSSAIACIPIRMVT